MTDKHDLTRGEVWRKLFGFFLPIAAGGIVQQLYNTVDGIIVGRYCGTAAFAAITGSVSQILNLMVGSFIALTGGAAVYIAQLYGIGDKEKIKKAVATSMYICAALGVVISILGFIFSRELLVFLNTPEDTLEDAVTYLKWCFSAAFAVMLYNMGSGIIRASGDSTRPFIYLCSCCVTNIVLDYVLVKIYGLGVWGAAVATAFSQLVSFILVFLQILLTKSEYKFCPSLKNFSAAALKNTLKYGIPSCMQQVIYGYTNVLVQVGINGLGSFSVAAWSLTSKVDGIYWAIINAAGVATMNFVGQNYGAGKLDRVKESCKKSLRNFMIFTVGIGIFLTLIGRSVLPFFLDDAAVVDLGYKLMVLFFIGYPAWTVIEILSAALKGCGDVIVPSVICLIGIAGIRVVWYYTAFKAWPNLYTLACAFLVSWFATAAAIAVRYIRGGWKKRREIK